MVIARQESDVNGNLPRDCDGPNVQAPGAIPFRIDFLSSQRGRVFAGTRDYSLPLLLTIHDIDQALRAHVGPVGFDVVQTGLAGVMRVDDPPASGHVSEGWPSGHKEYWASSLINTR